MKLLGGNKVQRSLSERTVPVTSFCTPKDTGFFLIVLAYCFIHCNICHTLTAHVCMMMFNVCSGFRVVLGKSHCYKILVELLTV